MNDQQFDLTADEIQAAHDMYCRFGEIDKYEMLDLMLKRSAAVVVLGVVKHMTPDQVREWSENDDFRASADALIMSYEIAHPDKAGPKALAAEFIMELSSQLDHSKCDHSHDDEDDHNFIDTSIRMDIRDDDVESKFADILAGFDDTADEPTARATRFSVGTDGETTDAEDGDK